MARVEKGGVPEELAEYDRNKDGKLDVPEAKTALEMEVAEGDLEGTRAAAAAVKEATLREQEDQAAAEGMKELARKEAEGEAMPAQGDQAKEEPVPSENKKEEDEEDKRVASGGQNMIVAGTTFGLIVGALAKPLRWAAGKAHDAFYGGLKSWDDEGLKILERTDVLKPEEEKKK